MSFGKNNSIIVEEDEKCPNCDATSESLTKVFGETVEYWCDECDFEWEAVQ